MKSARSRSSSEAGSMQERSRRREFSSSSLGSEMRLSSRLYVNSQDYSLPVGPTMSPLSDSEEERKEVDLNEAKEESIAAGEEAAGQNVVIIVESRNRMYSEGTYQTDDFDDDTIRDFEPKRRAPSTTDTAPRQLYLFGRAVPLWMTTKPKATNVATFLAKYAPCFWCSSEALNMTTTNQSILLRLNSLTSLFALVQLTSASFLTFTLFNDNLLDRDAQYVDRGRGELVNSPNFWSMNGNIMTQGLVAICTFVGLFCSRRHLREINLPGSLRFMWFMLWIIPIQIYLIVSLFDYHGVTSVWIRHWWAAKATAWFRSKTCTGGTYNTLCVVPIDGHPFFRNETAWCEFYYNSTSCTAIRNSAQVKTNSFALSFYTLNGVLGILVLLLLILMVKVLEGVITKPIMQKSRERNIPMWLTLPMVGCAGTGAVLLFSPSSILKIDTGLAPKSWPGVVYLIAAGLYAFASILGYSISRFAILNARDKQTKNFMVLSFIVVMTLTLCSVAAVFVGSVILSTSYVDSTMNYTLRGSLACSISAGSCSYCDNDKGLPECPEWSESDVSAVLKSQLKSSATIACLFMFYSLGALRFGFLLRKHISNYQIDYV